MSLPAPSPAVRAFLRRCLASEPGPFLDKMTRLGELLYAANREVNLTAIREESFWTRHVADSLSPALFFRALLARPARIADLGCGAGFPALVLAAAFPALRITAIDSTGKKVAFVRTAARQLALDNLTAVQGRGNELGRKAPYRGFCDAVFARAVASAAILIRESLALLKPGGELIVFRTPKQAGEELRGLRKLNRYPIRVTAEFELPEGAGTRLFLQIKQMRETH